MPRPPRSIAGALALASILIVPAAASAATADLAASNPDIIGKPAPGAEVTYTFSVSNAGPDAAAAMVQASIGEREQLISITPSQGTCTSDDPGTSLCFPGTIEPGASVAYAVKVKLGGPGNYGLTVFVNPDGAGDPNQDNNHGGINYNVEEPEEEVAETPTATTGGWGSTQATLKLEAELSPYGSGTWYFEYGTTKAYGQRTPAKRISTQKEDVARAAVIERLALDTQIHYRVVLVVDGKTYRGTRQTGRTLGKLLYPEITINAVERNERSTTYEGTIGDGLADAPGACKGTITMNVYTEAATIMSRKTTVNVKACSYRITIPFGTRDARRFGPKGKGVFVQAQFSGTKAVAAARSTSDRP